MNDFTCHREVTRSGYSVPCEKPATGYAYDAPEYGSYPACEQHRYRTTAGTKPDRNTVALVDLLARRPELRDVGIAGYLAGAAVEGAPGMPPMRGEVMLAAIESRVVFQWLAAAS